VTTPRSATSRRSRAPIAPEQVALGALHVGPSSAGSDAQVDLLADDDDQTLSVADAARLLGRDRTRVYALLRSGDLVAAPPADGEEDQSGPVRVVRASVERWLVAGGGQGGPLAPRNAWALIGLASGDQAFSERCISLLERPEELSRTRARLARETLVELAPRLRRRATLLVRGVPTVVREALEGDAGLVRTGVSAAKAYGWHELLQPDAQPVWVLDAYVPLEAFAALQEQLNRLDIDAADDDAPHRDAVLLRVVDEPWPFPPHYQLAAQPLAALDLLDYPHTTARHIGRAVLEALKETPAPLLARRTARARARTGPLLGRLLGGLRERRGPRPVVEGDPKTDTRAAAAHIVGVLWAAGRQGVTVKELRGATGISRERLETAYEFLLDNPPLGLAAQRHGEEFFLVSAAEVASSIERHLGNPRPVALSRAALEVLAIVAYRQPIARAGIELIRGSASDSALDTLLERGLIERNAHQLFVTTRAFLDHAGLRDLADLPPLVGAQVEDLAAIGPKLDV
jgi:segregation and condensation protein B